MLGENTINGILEGVKENLELYRDIIGRAYLKAEKGLRISIPVKLEPGKGDGAIQIRTGIALIAEKVRDENIRVINEKQLPLIPEKKG